MSTEDLLFEKDGAVAVITLNRPQKLNAVTPDMAEVIEAAIAECDASAAIRCVILTGAGNKAFCAGSEDAREGRVAFTEKRAPVFRCR